LGSVRAYRELAVIHPFIPFQGTPLQGKPPYAKLWLVMAVGLLLPFSIGAQIRTDGSLGQVGQSLAGPSFQIPQSLGKVAGGNLFHSFETFNLAAGEVASFSTTSAGLSNVISRVTGGTASQINGLIRLTPASGTPAFFFINPAGVTFGDGAKVDVPGSFHVSTANSVNFADGRFNADLDKISTLSSAAPEAFGFLGNTRASIAIRDGAVVRPHAAFPINVVAGDIRIDNGVLGAKGGAVHAVAVGDVSTDIALVGSIPRVTGALKVDNGGQISTVNSGPDSPPGQIALDAGDILLANGSNILSFNASSGQAGEITLNAQRIALRSDAYVYSRVEENAFGDGATIRLSASDSFVLDGRASTETSVSTVTNSGGNAGHILIQAGNISVTEAGYVSSDTFSSGSAGDILIQADNISLSEAGFLSSNTFPSSTGNTGSISLNAVDTIALSGRSRVYVATDASGSAGVVKLNATDIALGTGASVTSYSQAGSANAGDIQITAGKTLALTDDAAVISVSKSSGNAGALRIAAHDIVLDNASKIFSPAYAGTGNAGSVDVIALGNLSLRHGSFIDSSTYSAGHGGTIKVAATNMTIDQKSNISSIASEGSGNAGSIEVVSTGRLMLLNDGAITSTTFTQGNAGSVLINASNIDLQTGGYVTTTTFGVGNAGRISVKAVGQLAVDKGFISSRTTDAGRAGSIDISASMISLSGSASSIDAIADPYSSGQTGSITLNALDFIYLTDGALLSITNYATPKNTSNLLATELALKAPSIVLAGNSLVSSASTGNVSAGNISIDASKQLLLAGSAISTTATDGNGGRITALAGDLMLLDQSKISTSVLGSSGNGGDIQVKANSLILNQGFIQANTAARLASGGLVNLELANLVASGNTLFVGGQTLFEYVPDVFGFNVIQAAAPSGINGAIQITSPKLDLSGSLVGLSTEELDLGGLGRNPCDVSGGSSLVQLGYGGMPISFRGLLGGPAQSLTGVDVTSQSAPLTSGLAKLKRDCL
jgi:filamentous hemagglutinin family protein